MLGVGQEGVDGAALAHGPVVYDGGGEQFHGATQHLLLLGLLHGRAG
jgi:hypothetical protein